MNRNLMLTGITLAALSTIFACSEQASDENLGQLDLALSIEGDFQVTSVDVAIDSENLEPAVSRIRALNVSDPNATLSAFEGGLPQGDYTVSLSAEVADDPDTLDIDESEISCEGTVGGVEVLAGETASADLVLVCTLDGGQVQSAGAIRIDAETELEVVNNCPDLGSASIGSLDASVGSAIALATEVAEGVGGVEVEWNASAGTISEDGTTYTCPEVPGVYEITVAFERVNEFEEEAPCVQEWTEQIACHTSYQGPVEDLPSAFSVEGTCGNRSPCHLEQDGKAFKAVCGNRPDRLNIITGEADGENSFLFIDPRSGECQGSVVDGELVGSCVSDGESCEFSSNSHPAPDPYCPQVESLSNVQVCSGTYEHCSVAQDRCNLLLKCGDAYLGREVDAAGEVRIQDAEDGAAFYCAAPTVDGVATGTCEGSGSGASATCDYSAEISYVEQACEETMPTDSFILEGCGFEDYCVGVQSGCGWSLVCSSGRYTGVAAGTDSFVFTGPGGAACSASVVEGEFVGSCEGACIFGPREAALPGEDCLAISGTAYVSGCQHASTPYELIQDGCNIGGVSSVWGEAWAGVASETSITFPGDAGYQCEVSVSDEEGVLRGTCLPPVEGQRVCDLTVVLAE